MRELEGTGYGEGRVTELIGRRVVFVCVLVMRVRIHSLLTGGREGAVQVSNPRDYVTYSNPRNLSLSLPKLVGRWVD